MTTMNEWVKRGAVALAVVCLCGCLRLPPYSSSTPEEVERLERAISINPTNAHALFLLGKASLETGGTRKAAGYFERAITAKPDFEEAYVGLGVSHLEGNRYSSARAAYERLLARDASSVAALEGLATVAFEQKDLRTAAKHAKAALALDENARQANRIMGEIAYIEGRYADATAAWDIARGGDATLATSLAPITADLHRYIDKYGAK